MTSSIIETTRGKKVAVRVDSSFLCKCGCGKRVNGNKMFFSTACYGLHRKNQSLLTTPTCKWCGEIIPEGDRYCSQQCKEIDYYRSGWENQSLSNNEHPSNEINSKEVRIEK